MNIRESILESLQDCAPMTATQLMSHIWERYNNIATSGGISGRLREMFKEGILVRHPNFGPCGGYGYEIAKPEFYTRDFKNERG